MKYDIEKFRKSLSDSKLLKAVDFDKFAKPSSGDLGDTAAALIKSGVLTAETVSEQVYKVYGFKFVNLDNILISPLYLQMIPKDFSVDNEIVAFGEENGRLQVAMINPDNLFAVEYMRKRINHELDIHLTDVASFQAVIKGYKSNIQDLFSNAIDTSGSNGKDVKNLAEGVPVIKAVNAIIEYAVSEGASDIHIEPIENETVIRFRVDGLLQDMLLLLKTMHPVIVARIKIMANLKIDEHRRPQDGRIRTTVNDLPISLRVSVLPTYQGEKIVIRILDESVRNLTLEDLGFADAELNTVQSAIQRPDGMVLVTGPTGSGKTTTLYTIMKILNVPEVNINTIEDPIEYGMPRVNQTQVNPTIDVTFANGLRSLLRQDPDIIMVGEIRDEETADMAIHSSMTGHLVLSTLHTNDAPGAIPRFVDMGIEPFLLASTLQLVIAQRLVRKLCDDSGEQVDLDQSEKDLISQQLTELGMPKKEIERWTSMKHYKPLPSTKCKSGYKGRIGIYEVLPVTDKVRDLILQKATIQQLREEMIAGSFMPMFVNGLHLVEQGVTTLTEIIRVAKE